MSKVLTSLPVGERVGIAFSGGLDTSVAVAWMRDKGAIPCTYTADIGQYDEPDIDGVPDRALQYGAEIARAVDCQPPAGRGGPGRAGLRRLPHPLRRPRLLQHHAARPRGHRHACWCARCTRTASTSGATARPSRATTSSGSTATACSPTPSCASTSRGWTPTSSHELGGRAEMSQWLTEHDLPYRDSQEKAYSTDANIWGATHEAKTLEHLDVSLETVEPIMGVKFWDPAVAIETEDVTIRFEPGRPVAINGKHVRRPGRAGPRGQRDRRPARPRHVRPDREPDHRGQVARHLRGARAWRCSGSPTSGCSTPIHNEDTIANYHAEGRRLGRLLYEGRWLDPQALMLRESIQRWIASLVTGEVTLRLRRGEDYTILRTDGPGASPTTRTSCRWSAPSNAAFGPTDRIGQLTMRNLDIADSRAKLELYAAQPLDQGQVLVENGTLFGELEAGGADRIAEQPGRRGRRERRAPSTTPRWSSAPTDERRRARRHAPTRARSGAAGSPAARARSSRRCRGRTHFDWRLAPLRPRRLAGARHACCTRPACSTDDEPRRAARGARRARRERYADGELRPGAVRRGRPRRARAAAASSEVGPDLGGRLRAGR